MNYQRLLEMDFTGDLQDFYARYVYFKQDKGKVIKDLALFFWSVGWYMLFYKICWFFKAGY